MKRRSQHKHKKRVRDGRRKKSRYARKREYLFGLARKLREANMIKKGERVWGFEIPDPKPWK